MDFVSEIYSEKTLVTKDFFSYVFIIMYSEPVIYHSIITGKIAGFAHNLCNKKIRKHLTLIPIFVHNSFSSEMFFVVKGVQLCAWRTKSLNIGCANLTNVQYGNIRNQMKFIEYYQQPLFDLASSVGEIDKENIRKSMTIFLKIHNYFWKFFGSLTDEHEDWMLGYFCEGKGVIPYEKLRCYSNLEVRPDKGNFFEKTEFYSSLKNEIISDNDYENVKKILIDAHEIFFQLKGRLQHVR